MSPFHALNAGRMFPSSPPLSYQVSQRRKFYPMHICHAYAVLQKRRRGESAFHGLLCLPILDMKSRPTPFARISLSSPVHIVFSSFFFHIPIHSVSHPVLSFRCVASDKGQDMVMDAGLDACYVRVCATCKILTVDVTGVTDQTWMKDPRRRRCLPSSHSAVRHRESCQKVESRDEGRLHQ